MTEGSDGDYHVCTNGKEWRSEGDAPSRAEMEAAISELVLRRYIEDAGDKQETFEVTRLGHQTAESLR